MKNPMKRKTAILAGFFGAFHQLFEVSGASVGVLRASVGVVGASPLELSRASSWRRRWKNPAWALNASISQIKNPKESLKSWRILRYPEES